MQEKFLRFNTAEEMLAFINSNHDLYSRKAETYVFSYNECGSICTYEIDQDEATYLSEQCVCQNEYWSTWLGPGGRIWDDPSHELYHIDQATNLDCCSRLIQYDDWVVTDDFREIYL